MDCKYLAELAKPVRAAILDAGEIIKAHWDRPRAITRKGRIDLVTATDLAVEEALLTSLSGILPEASFLAEETANSGKVGRLCWIIDPVDGTTNFAHGMPFMGTSVALWFDGEPVLGFVNAPILGEFYQAVKGLGTTCNGKPVQVSAVADLENALVATGFPYTIREHIRSLMVDFESVVLHTQGVRRPGAASLDLAYVACGRFDAFYEMGLKPWDTAAGWLMVQEAGGQVSQYDAGTPYALGDQTILASNGRLHQCFSRLLGN